MKKPVKDTYKSFLKEVKDQIVVARATAAKSLNDELIRLNYNIGKLIVEKQKENSWGDNIVEQLSKDLNKHFGGVEGYSVQNLWYMRQFYMEYVNQKALLEYATQIPWGQNILIISKIKENKARVYY
jgi:predicted nuclease of restriction endonuclease-like (RecB) superfamily